MPDNQQQILSMKFRIKDSNSRSALAKLAGSVNHSWNIVNDLTKNSESYLSEFDVNNLTKGLCKKLNLHSTTIQEINKVHYTSRKTAKKSKLAWRSAKRGTLGWVPFKASAIRIDQEKGEFTYMKKKFRYYNSRNFSGKIVTGCFFQDSRDRWYVSIQVKLDEKIMHQHPDSEVGIDLGIKNKISLSDGNVYTRDSITKKYEKRLAAQQRANKKKQVKKIHAKIKDSRLDWTHKVTTNIAKQYSYIALGDLKVKGLIGEKAPINKALHDCAPGMIKSHLMYKTRRFGGEIRLVQEEWTTQTCSSCFAVTGPRGAEELTVRDWVCESCGTQHSRDENSGKVILILSKRPELRPKGRDDKSPYRALYAENILLKDKVFRESPSYSPASPESREAGRNGRLAKQADIIGCGGCQIAEEDTGSALDVGLYSNYDGLAQFSFPGSGGLIESAPGGFAGQVQLPFGRF